MSSLLIFIAEMAQYLQAGIYIQVYLCELCHASTEKIKSSKSLSYQLAPTVSGVDLSIQTRMLKTGTLYVAAINFGSKSSHPALTSPQDI